MASSSTSSRQMKHQVFLSFRGEDTRLNFTSHLLKALKNRGLNVFFDEEKLEKGEQLSQAISQAIAASNLSILVLSKDYASSKSCLGELSQIMKCKKTQGHIVLPIFYHVDPSHVRNIGGTFKTSFGEHESKRPVDEVKRWKAAFTEVGTLKGWHIEGGKFDRSETEYIKDVVGYVLKKLNSNCTSVSEELVGIEYQKNAILKLIKQKDCRVLGLWGMGGQGKTTLAEAVYKEISSEFESSWFLQNVREKVEKQGKESLRNQLFSKLLNSDVDIGTPCIKFTLTQKRLINKKVLVVLDDVDDRDQIEYMGVEYFGDGSKTIITSRDRQVLESGGADTIHEVKGLNEKDSLQLFSTFALKQLNTAVGFQDLSRRFVKYTQGNPLALKVLGSDLNKRSINYWESKVEKLKDCPPEKKIAEALKSSYDGLDIVEQNIFLDIACFFKGEPIKRTKLILSGCYKGADCGINKLVDKCLINVSSSPKFFPGWGYHIMRNLTLPDIIDMHDTLEEMGKDIVCQESKTLGKCSRLWNLKHVEEVLKYNKGTDRIRGIKLDMPRMDNLSFQPSVFKNMTNLRYVFFHFASGSPPYSFGGKLKYYKLPIFNLDIKSIPDELRYLRWDYYPFKSLSTNFNPKNLVALILQHGNMEQLWNKDHQDLVYLREINIFGCKNLKKIPNLLGALNLKTLDCEECESLVELGCLDHLTSLETGIKEVPFFVKLLDRLQRLTLTKSMVKDGSSNISKLKSQKNLDLSGCPIVKFPTVDVPSPSLRFKSLKYMHMGGCTSLKLLSELPPYLHQLDVHGCRSLEKVSFADQNLYQFDSLDDDNDDNEFFMLFCNCFNLNQESTNNIEANAMLKIGSLAKEWAATYAGKSRAKEWAATSARKYRHDNSSYFICCFPGNKISANKFNCQSMDCQSIYSSLRMAPSLSLKIAPNGGSGRRFLVFAICIVVDLTCYPRRYPQCICEYELTADRFGYEKRTTGISMLGLRKARHYMGDHVGDHVFILSSNNMVKKDQNYVMASFQFYINDWAGEKEIQVERCGVHVFYVDA
ncbi:disease resistance protein RPV1-like [Gossypium arboreum]|uniref:disease resistance protein RPV1-like n=1 Tax=Gossypium arboreum TaxID=29729 RepID=UPI0008192673|nr:disease resistance protein RPV1-like [Gossypium arboreum]XP_052875712.1 disease resistance protein RPV1-like [Gossypium arboreum]XP_052875713.1 disease resistance protein RPV1-like [Gossypium arboreum]XP_052875714.1 disease resistance protein RPV1-like [Gossypium arboreum]XP_052875715.1 disease resistance protein RPV1-like [Gossypium arboreum]XP_052875716.1 disease resistance protein RPV1-like [Gossypium arboreum]XP_052875717.1 disease resistance protein RPV1-like [Gossypium arboreum]XP_0